MFIDHPITCKYAKSALTAILDNQIKEETIAESCPGRLVSNLGDDRDGRTQRSA
jgi:hypothetical protein